ncbi:hypothetical protein [Campylobacter curvus]|uniref:hypothetical protein n=1 Tax=Campylobacter curvus TaxID=200 RepID=UPI001470267B|nr:hypothetical protein [Campylobacter curvus]
MASENNTSRILKLGIDEMFEDLTYNVAYQEVLNRLKANGMDDGILKDAINSGITIMFSSALMLYIQKQEEVIGLILEKVIGMLVLLLNPLRARLKGFLRRFSRGRMARIASAFVGMSNDSAINLSNVVVTAANSAFNAQQTANQYYNRADGVMKQKELLLHSKDQQLNYAKAKVDSFNQTLLFKLLTSRFTAQDKEILRRITGSTEVDIDKLNEVASFMYVKDDAGNITGLSEQFMTLLNGLGYFNSKGKK